MPASTTTPRRPLDTLDLTLIRLLRDHPRVGDLELSRLAQVARATVQSRLSRLTDSGVITGWGPDIDLPAAGVGVQAFVSLEIAQGALADVAGDLVAIPQVLEAYVVTGAADVLCKIAAADHEELQEVLLLLSRSRSVARSTSVVALTVLVEPRVLPVLETVASPRPPRADAYRGRRIT